MYNEWEKDFMAFYNYVRKLPNYMKDGYTLDRINNNGNYEPGNLRWADNHIQGVNQERFTNKKRLYVGVAKAARQGGYYAHITVQSQFHYLGKCDTMQGAAELRDNFIIKNKLYEYPIQVLNNPLDTLQ